MKLQQQMNTIDTKCRIIIKFMVNRFVTNISNAFIGCCLNTVYTMLNDLVEKEGLMDAY